MLISLHELFNTILVAGVAYVTVVLVLRLVGNRSVAKMNAFDLMVTFALGSILATVILSKEVALLRGLIGLVLLLFLQYMITWLSVRSTSFSRFIRSEPRLLLYRGRLLEQEMKSARVTKDELFQAVRTSGVGAIQNLAAVVMETDGSMSVIPKMDEEEEILTRVTKPKDFNHTS